MHIQIKTSLKIPLYIILNLCVLIKIPSLNVNRGANNSSWKHSTTFRIHEKDKPVKTTVRRKASYREIFYFLYYKTIAKVGHQRSRETNVVTDGE